jgi:two-component system sensor histidine kinase KdpD
MRERRGRLKLYLGYAAGVGKTYRMLAEAAELRGTGVDVVIAYFEPHAREATIALTKGFETIPRRGRPPFQEMDVEAVLRRKPAVAIVDELAHTSVEHGKRWQDVQMLLDAGIDVLTTMNVQHIESLNDDVWRVTGVRVRETVPDWVVDEAAEVVFVDLTPRALRHRLERGVVYDVAKAQVALDKFFTEKNLTGLREMAMRHTAHEVEEHLSPPAARRERILICVTGRPAAAMLIRRAKRVADYLQADCLAIYVAPGGEPIEPAVECHLNLARNLRIETHVVEALDVTEAISSFALVRKVTHIFIGRSVRPPWWKFHSETIVQGVIRNLATIQITIVAERRR